MKVTNSGKPALTEDMKKHLLAKARTTWNLANAFDDERMLECTFDRDDCPNSMISRLARRYVEQFDKMSRENTGLLFFGHPGTGKTYAAASIVNALCEMGKDCRMITASGEGLKWSEIEWEVENADLIVLDDFGAEIETRERAQIIQAIVERRYAAKKPIIVTTNLTADELKHPAEMKRQRIYSRLFEMCLPYEVVGDDKRKKILKQKFSATDRALN